MGLDITAYERVEFVRAATAKDLVTGDYSEAGLILLYPYPDAAAFPGREGPIQEGLYRSAGKELRFCAGSYMGYSEWRERLAELAGHPLSTCSCHAEDRHRRSAFVWHNRPTGTAFYELIDFADNEGVIAGDAALRLRDTFAEWADRASAFSPDGYWIKKYEEWRRAFELAVPAGCVDFH